MVKYSGLQDIIIYRVRLPAAGILVQAATEISLPVVAQGGAGPGRAQDGGGSASGDGAPAALGQQASPPFRLHLSPFHSFFNYDGEDPCQL